MPTSDLDINQLATYLHMTPQQILKLTNQEKIPGRRVSGEWRFNKAEIHHWLEERIGLIECPIEMRDMERGLKRTAGPDESEEVHIHDLLLPQAVAVPLIAKTRNSVIKAMCSLAMETGYLWDADQMAEAVKEREDLHPTALDNGVALLHPRRPISSILGEAFIALGITPGGIPFGGGFNNLTDIFFLICSTDDRIHLRMLARLSRLVMQSDLVTALREASDPAAALRLIAAAEGELEH